MIETGLRFLSSDVKISTCNMKIEVPKFLKNIRERKPKFTSDEERVWAIEQATERIGLRGYDIWALLIQAVNEKNQSKLFWEGDVRKIVKIYGEFKKLYPLEDVPVAEVVQGAQVADLSDDGFLTKVCFNYDYQLKGPERLREDAERYLQAGHKVFIDGKQCIGSTTEGKSVKEQGARKPCILLVSSDVHYWTVEMDVKSNLQYNHTIENYEAFNRREQKSEQAYMVTTDRPNRDYIIKLREKYQKQVLPIL